jgi:glyoxylase-like metal-dependent hydrolase (beta-lactamase superfamily II)
MLAPAIARGAKGAAKVGGVARTPAVRLADDVWRIPTLPFDLLSSLAFVEADGSVTLVDCGIKRAPPRIVAGLAAMGKAPGDVTRIVLTHAHTDHAGGLAEVRRRAGGPDVEVHEADAGYVREGISAPFDTSFTLGRLMTRGPDQRFEPVEVARVLRDGDVLPVAGGLRVVHTPGHTPGHVSLLHPGSGVLVTGDALFNIRGVRWPFGPACTDAAQCRRSAQRLVDLEYSLVAFTHGPEIRTGARDAVAAFLGRRTA